MMVNDRVNIKRDFFNPTQRILRNILYVKA